MADVKKPVKLSTESVESTAKECFIIMPITTPDEYVPRYKDDPRHFAHVLECLFIPAIEKAGLKPIKPIATGADLIHGRTIKLIEKSDITLCDISIYNPNVFFELGIRTALNKPVCLVKDNYTEIIPFDTSGINHHTYQSSLSAWDVDGEVDRLATHISDTLSSSHKGNELWMAFSISTTAPPLDEKVGTSDQIAYFTRTAEALLHEIRRLPSALSSRRAIDTMIEASLGRGLARNPQGQNNDIPDLSARLHLLSLDKDFIDLKKMIWITATSLGTKIQLTKDDLSKTIIVESSEAKVVSSVVDLLSEFSNKHNYEIVYSDRSI